MRHPGHFEKSAGLGKAEYVVPWQFTLIRDYLYRAAPVLPWGILAAALLWFGAALRRKGNWRSTHTVGLFLWLTALTQLPICILGDGLFGLERHLILARFSIDVLLLLMCAQMCGFARVRQTVHCY